MSISHMAIFVYMATQQLAMIAAGNDSSKEWTSIQKHLLEVQIDKYYSLPKLKDFKNCMLEFLKQQEILRKQEMEKIENQHQEVRNK